MVRSIWFSLLVVFLSGWIARGDQPSADSAREPSVDPARITAVRVEPPELRFSGPNDYRQLLITGTLASGETVDLTRAAALAATSDLVAVDAARLVRPLADGHTQLDFSYARYTASVGITTEGFGAARPVSFVRDVQPVLSRMGCNAGTCHGAKDGKAGFKLSLRGYDPLYDHQALTDEIGARRFNRAAPDQSLMLLKATGSIPHVGGVRTSVDSPYYRVVREWIAAGARLDLDAPRVRAIEILPRNPVLPLPGLKQQVSVIATYADGATRDVTREAFVESGNIEVVQAEDGGQLRLLRRGEAPVLVRYEGAYAATTLTCMGERDAFVWQDAPRFNAIDDHVYAKLQRVKVLPAELCTDHEFARRLYLDLTGLPPTPAQLREFGQDSRDSRAKREALVDRLLGSPAFVEHWTNKWADLLQVNRKFLGEEGAILLRNWIKQAVAANLPYDQFAREILTASGSTLANPPAAYYKILREPAAAMENTTHLFLAVRFNCNKCHDHPFERWTQDQYYELASFFTQIGRKEDADYAGQRIGGTAVEGAAPLVEVIYDTGQGEIKHDRTGALSAPRFPFTHQDLAAADAPRREQLARWLTSAENQYFAMSYVNRLWGYLFGVGIIEPIDDIRAGNPPTNPELLSALTREFVSNGFDARHMLRMICTSRTYQHASRTNAWNDDDQINFSHALPRRLPAEVLFDAIHAAAGSPPRIPGVPPGFRAAELPDAGVSLAFLDDFGRPTRESACECERSGGLVLGPIMKLVNGPTVAEAIGDPHNAIAQLVAAESDDARLIAELFVRFLNREPTAAEIQLGIDAIHAVDEDVAPTRTALAAHAAKLAEQQAAWERQVSQPVAWQVLQPTEMKSKVGAQFQQLADGVVAASGQEGQDVYTITAETTLARIRGLRLEALADPSLPAGGPGRAQNGNFVLSELTLSAAPIGAESPQPIKLHDGSADFSQANWDVNGAVDGNETTGWAVSPQFNQHHTATFIADHDAAHERGWRLTISLSQQFPDGRHSLGRFRLAVTDANPPFGRPTLPAHVTAALAVAADARDESQRRAVIEYYQSLDPEFQQLQAAAERAAQQSQQRRLIGAQDLAWALINNPAFLFNH